MPTTVWGEMIFKFIRFDIVQSNSNGSVSHDLFNPDTMQTLAILRYE